MNTKPLPDTLEVINTFIATQEQFISTLDTLLIKSEARIDRTNDMIDKLSHAVTETISTLSLITEKYCKHIDEATSTRDEVFHQNNTLIESNREITRLLQDSQSQNSQLLNAILTYLSHHTPPTAASITVNQQPQP